ncbi:sphingosine hydroxylase [Russula earlei]|uniref:Sphingosine hydroxylase n=1 Tax=Russula earlei TaxID=71964 RepID=A0ACC0UIN0_9AGAM|nr:sphingosine hydroxylase [Russula earlei]
MSSSSYNLTTILPPDRFIFHAHPLYYSPSPSLIPFLSDPLLAALAPLPAYWLTSGFFHILDSSTSPWLARHRIHESSEVASRNRATRLQVLRAVLFQQALQTVLGILWVSEHPQEVDHATAIRTIAHTITSSSLSPSAFDDAAATLAYTLYWWLIPAAQLLVSMIVLDTWQYFLHRAMHLNRFLYKHLHSVHHRLYVPYAYGALYNHPIEGFLLDSLGAVLSETFAHLSVRQAMLFFVLSTCKTVDDHCGYRLPFDPFQLISGNTADYHDIHHQVIGIKSNFSQPWFVHWDVILGTRMTRQDIEERREKLKTS